MFIRICILPLAGTRYLLLEADRQLPGPDPIELVHELKIRGWRPVFARDHPNLIPCASGNSVLQLTVFVCRRI